jgi:RNA polymerase sigma factor (sigma-70 family)
MEGSSFNEKSTDEYLCQGCLEGHRLAQELLYRRHFPRLMPIALRYLNNREEAVEVLNQAFLKIFSSIPSYKATGSFAGWMARIVFNTTIDFVRQRTIYRQRMDFESSADMPVVTNAIDHLAAEDILALIQKLPANQRTIFNLYVIDGYKHREIADMMNIDENTSKWHLSQARLQLQKMLGHTSNMFKTLLLI